MSTDAAYLYEDLATDLAGLVAKGTLRPGDRLPSVRQLSLQRSVSVSTVLHKAYVDVNEEGTEAAAATFAGVAALGVRRSDVFRADHPFIFLIRDNTTGSLLFLGRLSDPRPM